MWMWQAVKEKDNSAEGKSEKCSKDKAKKKKPMRWIVILDHR